MLFVSLVGLDLDVAVGCRFVGVSLDVCFYGCLMVACLLVVCWV